MEKYPLYRHIENPIIIGYFTIGKKFMTGNYNIIYRGKFNDSLVAVRINKLSKENFFDEVNIFEDLDNSSNFIVNYYGWSIVNDKYTLVLEFIENDLHTVVNKQILSDSDNIRIIKQIANGINDIHKYGYSVSDLKLENILIDKNLNIKLIDFDPKALTYGMFPPERLESRVSCQSGDIWLFGITIYMLCTKNTPFTNVRHEYIEKLKAKVKPKLEDLSDELLNICEKCIQYENRISLPELLELINKL